ncbi:MAG: hypothetical protein HC837_04580 [Chloroflexaceae bacterium]|nr:hypothetical protein [Chloroflexaceae bacterium]
MQESNIFIEIAQQQGFHGQQAHETLKTIGQQLHTCAISIQSPFYIFRTGGGGTGQGGQANRPRLLLAFPSADDALAFAQHQNLRPTPRLLRVSVHQLLAILLQRPAITALILVDEHANMSQIGKYPHGYRLERTELLTMLKGDV